MVKKKHQLEIVMLFNHKPIHFKNCIVQDNICLTKIKNKLTDKQK